MKLFVRPMHCKKCFAEWADVFEDESELDPSDYRYEVECRKIESFPNGTRVFTLEDPSGSHDIMLGNQRCNCRPLETCKAEILDAADVVSPDLQGELTLQTLFIGGQQFDFQTIRIVFDGPPAACSGRFVEVEDEQGKSINFGAWHSRPDGLWELRFTVVKPHCG